MRAARSQDGQRLVIATLCCKCVAEPEQGIAHVRVLREHARAGLVSAPAGSVGSLVINHSAWAACARSSFG